MKMEPAATQPANESGKGSLARPKRPLSAFNLFYRFKRQHVTDAIALGVTEREAIVGVIEALPGLERCPPEMIQGASPEVVAGIRRHSIRKGLVDNLLPRDTRDRSHRKDRDAMNGAMGFVELAGVMRASWKACDDLAKEVFRELADEGREIYVQRVNDWKEATSKELALRDFAAKQPSSEQPPGEPTNNYNCDVGKAPPNLAPKDAQSQDGNTIHNTVNQSSSQEGQQTDKCSGARKTSPGPALDDSHSQEDAVSDDMAGAKSLLASKRDVPENECAARGPSNSHDVPLSSQIFKQDATSGGSGASPNDLHNASMDCSSFQGKFIKQEESGGRNVAPLIQGAPRPLSSHNDAGGSSFFAQGATGGSNDPNDPLFAGSLAFEQDTSGGSHRVSPNHPRDSSMGRSAFQSSRPPAPSGPSEVEERLQARVRELEAQLSAERLRARVRELEGQLARQRTNEELMTRQLEALSRNNHTQTSMDILSSAQGGNLHLLSALSRMSEARDISSAEQHGTMHLDDGAPIGKRQRLD